MTRVKLDQDTFGLSAVLERLTGAQVKDCFKEEDTVYFIVAPGQVGKALGQGGMHIKRLQTELGKRVKIIEYSNSVTQFVRNIIFPLQVQEVVEDNNAVLIRDSSRTTKSMVIGRDAKNLKVISRAVQRFFNKEVKVE